MILFLQTPQPESPATLSAKLLTEKIEYIESGTKTLEDFKGKIVLLSLYGRGSGEAAGKLSADLALTFAKEKDFVRVSVADLAGAPGFLRGSIRKGVRDGAKKGEEKTKSLFENEKLTYAPENASVYLLDWKGIIAKELGVGGKTERTYQIFVIGKKGELLFRYSQPSKPPKDDDPSKQIENEIKKALDIK